MKTDTLHNNFFSPERAWILLRSYLSLNWRQFMLGLGAVAAVILMIVLYAAHDYLSVIHGTSERSFRMYEFWMGEVKLLTVLLFVAGTLFASRTFSPFSSRGQAADALMMPASVTEKFLVRWVVTVPVFFTVMWLMMFVGEMFKIAYLSVYHHIGTIPIEWSELFTTSNYVCEHYGWLVIMGFLALQSFFILGSTVWSSHHFLKTLVSVAAIIAVYTIFCVLMAENMKEPGFAYPTPWILRTPERAYHTFMWTCGAITLFNWGVTYLRLREAEIVNRW